MSSKAKEVQTYATSGNIEKTSVAWNTFNHDALLGAEQFKTCNETMPRLSYSISLADASAVGMHYGLLPWSEGTSDIGASLQIIDALPHSATIEREWNLVDRLYRQTCGMHHASCKPLKY